MIKWSEVIKLKVLGGLGLENLAIKNCALLAKWWWRYGEEKDALWRRIIVFKYGKDKWGGFIKESLGIGCLGFRQSFLVLGMCQIVRGKCLIRFWLLRWAKGVIRFWLDDWLGVGPLCRLFPRVFKRVMYQRLLLLGWGQCIMGCGCQEGSSSVGVGRV